jgi:hypothetical protein
MKYLCRSALEVGAQRPSPGSIGKLKLSSEMRQRLEKVTANHSVRSTKTTEKPALPREDGKVKRLEDNRKLLLEQQLGNYFFPSIITVAETAYRILKVRCEQCYLFAKVADGTITLPLSMTRKASLPKARPT